MDEDWHSPPIAERSFSGRRATGNRFKKRASTSSARMAGIFASSRPRASSPDRRSGRLMAPALFSTNSPWPTRSGHAGLGAQASVESRIVSVDVATGARVEHASGPGLKLSPQFLDANRIGYLAKSGTTAALTFSSGEKGSVGDIGNPSWSRDGRRVVYHSGPISTIPAPRTPGQLLSGRDARYDLLFASGFPAVSPDGRQLVVSERTGRGNPDDRTVPRCLECRWNEPPAHLPRGRVRDVATVVRRRTVDRVRCRLVTFVARATSPAQIMIVKPDGSGARALTTGPGNSGFPSWSPDGKQVVYRFWNDRQARLPERPNAGRAAGLRIFNVSDGAVRTLTTGYDNFPCWSAKGRIVFSRFVNDEFHIFAINPDGTSLTQLTKGPYDDTHPACVGRWRARAVQHVRASVSRTKRRCAISRSLTASCSS